MKRRFLSIAWIGVIFLVKVSAAAGQPTVNPPIPEKVPVYQPKYYPFDGGERAVYKASWNGVPVATAVIATTSQLIGGKKFYSVRVEAKTSPILDLFWKMRDTITSTIEAKPLAPTRFTFSQRENLKVIDTEAKFDRTAKKWLVHRDERTRGKEIRIRSTAQYHRPDHRGLPGAESGFQGWRPPLLQYLRGKVSLFAGFGSRAAGKNPNRVR